MNRRFTISRILVTVLALVVACIFCAAKPGTSVHKSAKAAFAEQDREDQKTAGDKAESAQKDKTAATAETVTCENVPGGSAGGGTFRAYGIVNDEGDAIIFKKKSCAVENPDVLKAHKGHHVLVTGRVVADKKAIHVDNIKMPDADAKPAK